MPELAGRVGNLPPAGQPYAGYGAVVTFGEEIRKNDWAGYRRIVKVWPYADEEAGGFDKVEELAAGIEAALHEAVLGMESPRIADSKPSGASTAARERKDDSGASAAGTAGSAQAPQSGAEAGGEVSGGRTAAAQDAGEAFTCVYLGSADGDRADAALGGMTRGLRFAAYRRPAGEAAGPGEAGAELTALAELTSALLGADWKIAADRWPAAFARPCVLWRLAGSRKVTAKPSAFDVRRTYAAHVLGRGSAEEREALSRLAERLSAAQRLAPSASGRRGATIADVAADLEADGFLKGQLRLDVLERAAAPGGDRPGETAPPVLIGRVELKQAD
uniref:hypothetical protein n=1 Tax=Saccharibacillus sp. CPCC 101409 TaxID=3058041 RepID=UPI00267356D7|nr:hypothetical protein [Saccharibacillus sp. CPCC 101409]